MEMVIRYSVILFALVMSFIQYKSMSRIDDFPERETRFEQCYIKIQPMFLMIVALYLAIKNVSYITAWKYICILAILWTIAFVDKKRHIIPNEYLAEGLGIRVVFLFLEIFTMQFDAFPSLLADLIGCAVILAFSLLIRVLSRKGLGMGDVKLFAIMPLFLGTLTAMEAMLYSLIVSFFQACYYLISKKKGKKDVMPFGPAILCGTFLAIIIAGI